MREPPSPRPRILLRPYARGDNEARAYGTISVTIFFPRGDGGVGTQTRDRHKRDTWARAALNCVIISARRVYCARRMYTRSLSSWGLLQMTRIVSWVAPCLACKTRWSWYSQPHQTITAGTPGLHQHLRPLSDLILEQNHGTPLNVLKLKSTPRGMSANKIVTKQ